MNDSSNVARKLAICVDDFGLHPGINEAVIHLATRGRISAVSCMTASPSWIEGARELRHFDPSALDVGMHLDLTERPFNTRIRKPLARLLAAPVLPAYDRRALRAEIDQQLDSFELAMGRPPAHVDGHQHVHQFPVIRQQLVEALASRYVERRPWLRSTRCAPGARPFTKPWIVERLGCDGLTRLVRDVGFAQNARLLGIYGFRGGMHDYEHRLADWLASATTGDLLMCHVASSGGHQDPILAARLNEYQVFFGSKFDDLLRDSGITVTSMTTTLRTAQSSAER